MPKAFTIEQMQQAAYETARDMMMAAINTIAEKAPEHARNEDLNMILAMAFSLALNKAAQMDQRIINAVMRSFTEETVH